MLIFGSPISITMSNLHVSCHKIFVLLIFVLAIFFSCTDDDLFYDRLGDNSNNPLTGVPVGETENDSTQTNEPDNPGGVLPDSTVANRPDTTPMAIAAATPSSGILPLEVIFKGSSSSDDKKITAYIWDFKDGKTSTAANPSHTFTEAGTYDVQLKVTDADGLTSTDIVSISVNTEDNAMPVAKASATPQSGTVPLEVKFNANSSSDDKSITSYKWNFTDGDTTSVKNPLHTFTKAGSYDVELTVTDAEGLISTDTVSIAVNTKDNVVPVAKLTATPTSGTAPLNVTFKGTNSTDDKAITKFSYDFKDGTTSAVANPSHTFTEAGTYDVKLTVTDAEGLTSNVKVTISVTSEVNKAPVSKAIATPASGQVPLNVSFKGTTSTDDKAITAYRWDFKDGTTSTAANPAHNFTTVGTYEVGLKVTDAEGLTSTDNVTVTVKAKDNAAPVAKVSATPESGTIPLKVNFTGTKSSDDKTITEYSWDFKDGGITTLANPTHTFTKAGSYEVALKVTDAEGLSSTGKVTITAKAEENAAPVAKISATPITGTVPLAVTFKGNTSTDDKAIASYAWNFKDGGTASTANAGHTFTKAGSYVVALKVTDAGGLSATETVTISVNEKDNEVPVAKVSATPQSGTVPLAVSFKGNTSSDDKVIASYNWDFKDGTTASTANPGHTFTKAGTYEVALKVTDAEGLNATETVSITVNDKNTAPVANPSATPQSGTVPLAVSFKGSTSADDKAVTSYAWDFKDGATASTANPAHTFTKAGTYQVALKVTDAEGLNSTKTITIAVTEKPNAAPVAKVSATPSSGTVPLAVSFSGNTSSDDKAITSYTWNFKDGTTASTANPGHTFTKAGTYAVSLKVTDAEGLNTTETVTITVNEKANASPVAKVSATPQSGTLPLAVSFKGITSSDDKAITAYAWNFKDGTTSTTANPVHTFTKAGSYDAQLTVTDAEGLKNTANITVTVNAKSNEEPVAVMSADKLSGNAPLAVKFTGSKSTDDTGIKSYAWNFKDGGTSTVVSPSHTFDKSGSYNVELTVTDEKGLTDKSLLTITVNQPTPQNEAPVAVATASPLSGNAPLNVNFQGTSSNDDKAVKTYLWNFGNGNTSSSSNPTTTYNNPGVYNAKLTVTDAEGLSHSDTVTITVTQENVGSGCTTVNGTAGDIGFKAWCVKDLGSSLSGSIANGDLKVDKDGSNSALPVQNGQIKFNVTPDGSGNKRAEIRTAPWLVKHPKGTEEWFGWSYTFGSDYKPDVDNQWGLFQIHAGTDGADPNIALQIIKDDQFNGHSAGELFVAMAADNKTYDPTGIKPVAGQTLNIVIHIIHGDNSNGLLEIWINEQKVFDFKGSTIFSGTYGGNAKWGIYKWPWSNQSNVQKSASQGITSLTTYMGDLRMITRRQGDADYGKNSYSQVVPR